VRKALWLGLGLLLAVSSAAADDWNKSFTLSGKPQLRVDAKDGNVYVSVWDKNQIDAHVSTVGYKIGNEAVRISERQTGDRVEIELQMPHEHWCFGYCHRSIRLEVKVPRQADLDLHTGDGNIEGDDVQGSLQFTTGDGNVTFHSIGGKLRARTGDGNIRISGRFDDLDIHTGDGNVEAEAVSGSKMDSSWLVRTGDGNVELRVPSDLSADVDVRTGDGRITFDLPVTISGTVNRSALHGKLNQGGPMLEVRTGDGNVHLGGR